MHLLRLVLLFWLMAGLAWVAKAQKTIADFTFKQPIAVKEPTVFVRCRFEAKPFSACVTVKKKASARFENCSFVGKPQSQGIESFGATEAMNCTFTGFGVAVKFRKPSTSVLTANHFLANRTAIEANTEDDTNPLNLTMQCNSFDPGTIPQNETRYGLVVADGTLLDRIGGADNQNTPGTPNANAWPVVDRTLDFGDWESPAGWVSIENNSGIEFQYWKYENEFLLNNYTDLDVEVNGQFAYTANFPPSSIDPLIHVEVCDNFVDEEIFPVTRPRGNDPGVNANTEVARLGDAEPNPAKVLTAVQLYLPKTDAKYKVELWDVSGKRKFATTEPNGVGNLKAELRIDGLPKGIYLYRLTENGVPVAVKRLAIE